ncbi:MAG: formyltransferase family protein [Planctomycetota bacterium]|jgi:methionyl-tRNA formyltransferase
MTKIGYLITGLKGLNFFRKIQNEAEVAFVCTYCDEKVVDDCFEKITLICRQHAYPLFGRSGVPPDLMRSAALVFVVGWQFLIDEVDDRFVIFHDSILPRYRGFAPTVTALINGDRKIGVSALKPSKAADEGPVYGVSTVDINYPIKIFKAFEMLGDCYVKLGKDIIKQFEDGSLKAVSQNGAEATYSIWRDEESMFIDWRQHAGRIQRFVDALGFPYSGAKTSCAGEVIVIDDVALEKDLKFEDRCTGKIWRIDSGQPSVICGEGILKILSARRLDGSSFRFKRLRQRLGRYAGQ